jgi:hypothetical protein
MHFTRLIAVVFLILAIVFSYSLPGRREMSQAWQNIRPNVIQAMDSLYATIRNLVAGMDANHGIDDKAPGVNFDEVITLNQINYS